MGTISLLTLLLMTYFTFETISGAEMMTCPKGELKLAYGHVKGKGHYYLECLLQSGDFASGVATQFRLYDIDRFTLLAVKNYTFNKIQDDFHISELSDGLANKNVICSFTRENDSVRCPEIFSNTIAFSAVCQKNKEIYYSTRYQELGVRVSLMAPYEFYCHTNMNHCTVKVHLEFKNNIGKCLDLNSGKNGTTPLLVLKNQSCEMEFNATNWDTGIYLLVVKNKHFYVQTHDYYNLGIMIKVIFENEKQSTIMQCDEIGFFWNKLLGYTSCYSRTDPHIKTFTNLYFDIHEEGEFLMYQDEANNIQVRTRQQRCGDDVGCNYAASVQIHNTVYVYEIVSSMLKEKIYNSSASSKHIKTEVRPNKEYEIPLTNGDTVIVWLERSKFSLTIEIRQPILIPSIKGFCMLNELSEVEGNMEFFRIPEGDSNFKGVPTRAQVRITLDPYLICRCETGTACVRSPFLVECT